MPELVVAASLPIQNPSIRFDQLDDLSNSHAAPSPLKSKSSMDDDPPGGGATTTSQASKSQDNPIRLTSPAPPAPSCLGHAQF